jgi:hypothetical protein
MANASPPVPSPMTARDALHALGDLPRYEESLTAKAGGMTSMVWGIAGAGIFMTYLAAGDWLEQQEAYWGLALLWVPWVAAGIALTGSIWISHAVSLRSDPKTGKGLAKSMGFTLLFLAIAAGLFLGLDVLAGVEWTVNSIMTLANGLFALAMAAFQLRGKQCGAGSVVAAGAVMVAAGIALGLADVGNVPSGLIGAAVVGGALFTAGLVTYRQG